MPARRPLPPSRLEAVKAYYFTVVCYRTRPRATTPRRSAISRPWRGRSRRDGLSDAQETVYGTDPELYDSNGDGISDAEAVAFWGDAWSGDADGAASSICSIRLRAVPGRSRRSIPMPAGGSTPPRRARACPWT
jgi:hypothetical protein